MNILIVEDSDTDILILKRAVLKAFKEVVVYVETSGEDALSFLNDFYKSKGKIDLALLDINLPEMSGLDVLKVIKKQGPYQSIIACVLLCMDDDPNIEKAVELNADLYLRKSTSRLFAKGLTEKLANL